MRTLRLSLAGTVILALLGGLGGAVVAQADPEVESPVVVTFYHTADIHENGARLAQLAGFVEARRDDDPNVLLVDSGDWFNKGQLTGLETRGEAIAAILGAMEYDALTIGNHEHTYGTPRLAELIDGYDLPVVTANLRWPEDFEPEQAPPYRIFELEGVTVAIIGVAGPFAGPAFAMREADELVEFLPIEESIGDLVTTLEEHADIVALVTHVGNERDVQLAQILPGVDIIFGGHDHMERVVYADTIVLHSGANGRVIGELTLVWDGEQIVGPEVRFVRATDELPTSAAVEEIHQEYVSQAE